MTQRKTISRLREFLTALLGFSLAAFIGALLALGV